jgi:MutS domain V
MDSRGPARSRGFMGNVLAWLGVSTDPILDWPFSPAEVSRFHRSQTDTTNHAVDEQTWRDLELDAYCARVTDESSIFAKQMLHHRLRTGLHESVAAEKTERIRLLYDDASRLSVLKQALQPLREADTEISELLFAREFATEPGWTRYLLLAPLALAAAIGAIYFSLYALIAVGAVIVIITALQRRLEPAMEAWVREAASLRKLLRAYADLHTLAKDANAAVPDVFPDSVQRANAIHHKITRLPVLTFIPGFTDYADWYFLKNIRHYFACLATVKKERAFLQRCFTSVADIDADVAIAHELRRTKQFCWAIRIATKHFAFTDFVHPMLPDAQPLTISFDNKGALVTGQNGVGKSTFLRAIGVNLIVARACGFCYATSATASTLPVYASLNNPDSLSGGESSYIAELRRARELLQANENGTGSICLIDEIFRGTNHLESVSASAAVLHALARHALVIASTHHIVLAPILTQWLTPIAIEIAAGTPGKLRIEQGVLSKTNGIELLDTHGLGSDVSASARRVEAWLREYLAHPETFPNLLAA